MLNDIKLANVLEGEVPPFAICIDKHKMFPYFLVKTNGDKKSKAVFLEMVKKLEDPNAPKVHGLERVQSVEETIAKVFENERNTLRIMSLFTLIAVIISILGTIEMGEIYTILGRFRPKYLFVSIVYCIFASSEKCYTKSKILKVK